MTKYKLPGDEITGTYPGTGEEWRLKAKDGVVSTNDEGIAARLAELAEAGVIEIVKGSK